MEEEQQQKGELVDDLMASDERVSGARRAELPRLRSFWHAATRGRYWPATVVVVLAVVAVLIYFAVGLIADLFAGIVQ